MKARIGIDKKTKQKISQEVKAEYGRQGRELSRRHIKLFCVALNEEFGFGKKRLLRLIQRYGDLGAERKEDEIFWSHIDRYIEQIGLDFPREDYEVMDI
jgi:hypothetical protein